MKICRCCGATSFVEVGDFGLQPRCFDFQDNKADSLKVDKFQFGFGQCLSCGVIQVVDPIPTKELVASLPWVKNREPEAHLSKLASDLIEVLGSNLQHVLLISQFDTQLGVALQEDFGVEVKYLDAEKHLQINCDEPGQPMLQEAISAERFADHEDLLGKFNLVVSCRMLEHARDPRAFLNALSRFLSSEGRVLIEIPESSKSLEQGDIAMLWEEHISYFTRSSVESFLNRGKLLVEEAWVYDYPQEDALALLARPIRDDVAYEPSLALIPQQATDFGIKLSEYAKKLRQFLTDLRSSYGEIVVFGAGHRSVVFLNCFGLSDLISAFIDDDERKQGHYVPGTEIPISPSVVLGERRFGVCLLSIRIDIEEKVTQSLLSRFGSRLQCYSISPDSNLAFPVFR